MKSDTIYRQGAIDALMSWVEEHKDDAFGGCLFHWTGIKALLEDLPSAQPEVIRCGECKNHIDGRCIIANHHTSVMDNCGSVMGAERRGDG